MRATAGPRLDTPTYTSGHDRRARSQQTTCTQVEEVSKFFPRKLVKLTSSLSLAVSFARERARCRSRCDPLHSVSLRSPRSARLVVCASLYTNLRSLRSLRYACALRLRAPLLVGLRYATPTSVTHPLRVWCELRSTPTDSLRSCVVCTSCYTNVLAPLASSPLRVWWECLATSHCVSAVSRPLLPPLVFHCT